MSRSATPARTSAARIAVMRSAFADAAAAGVFALVSTPSTIVALSGAISLRPSPEDVIVAVISSFLGVYLSFFIDSAPAPTIVLLMTIAFIAAFVFVTSNTARLQGREADLATESNEPGGQPRM